jgi:hypothetical protein
MSKFTKAKTKDGDVLTFAMQQYAVGLYICIYRDGKPIDQFGTTDSQEKFIEKLREDQTLILLENEDESETKQETSGTDIHLV